MQMVARAMTGDVVQFAGKYMIEAGGRRIYPKQTFVVSGMIASQLGGMDVMLARVDDTELSVADIERLMHSLKTDVIVPDRLLDLSFEIVRRMS